MNRIDCCILRYSNLLVADEVAAWSLGPGLWSSTRAEHVRQARHQSNEFRVEMFDSLVRLFGSIKLFVSNKFPLDLRRVGHSGE